MIYLVEVILLIDFIVIEKTKIDIATEKDRSIAITATKENNYNITIEENNKNNNKAEIAIYTIYANSRLTNLTKLSILISLRDLSVY